MKKQETKKQILDGFKPSTGDESYLNPGTDKKSDADMLSKVAEGVRNDLTHATENMLSAGEKLRYARKLIGQDVKYGKWCKAEFPGISRPQLHRIRAVADDPKLRAAIKKGLAFSTVAELLSAPESVKDEVLESDEKVTKAQVREKVQEAKGDRSPANDPKVESAEEFEQSIVPPEDQGTPDPEREITVIDIYSLYLQRPVKERIQAFIDTRDPDEDPMIDSMGTNWAFLIFGVADTWEKDEHAPNREETEARFKTYAKVCHPDGGGTDELFTTLKDARDIVHNFYVM